MYIDNHQRSYAQGIPYTNRMGDEKHGYPFHLSRFFPVKPSRFRSDRKLTRARGAVLDRKYWRKYWRSSGPILLSVRHDGRFPTLGLPILAQYRIGTGPDRKLMTARGAVLDGKYWHKYWRSSSPTSTGPILLSVRHGDAFPTLGLPIPARYRSRSEFTSGRCAVLDGKCWHEYWRSSGPILPVGPARRRFSNTLLANTGAVPRREIVFSL